MKFHYTILGRNQMKGKNGFSGEGPWICFKCFLDNGKDYGEFYLNLNQMTKEGEFKFKDHSYGNFLTMEFAKEMLNKI